MTKDTKVEIRGSSKTNTSSKLIKDLDKKKALVQKFMKEKSTTPKVTGKLLNTNIPTSEALYSQLSKLQQKMQNLKKKTSINKYPKYVKNSDNSRSVTQDILPRNTYMQSPGRSNIDNTNTKNFKSSSTYPASSQSQYGYKSEKTPVIKALYPQTQKPYIPRIYGNNTSSNKKHHKKKQNFEFIQRKIVVFDGITDVELANRMAITHQNLKKKLRELGVNSKQFSIDVASFIVEDSKHIAVVNSDKVAVIDQGQMEDYVRRPPIVTIVGHVDHGKTSLLDALRKTNITGQEAGGITQSIGGSQIDYQGKTITFIDTPGHEAFLNMRKRGLSMTDIVVLVIAGDDGIKEQTIESINNLRTYDNLIVAITKCDKPTVNTKKIANDLLKYNLTTDMMNGNIPLIEVSSHTQKNLDKLLEIILLLADQLDIKGNHKCKASGIIMETYIDKHLGPSANVLIRNGTLRINDFFVSDGSYGKAKGIFNDKGLKIKEAGISSPIKLIGFKSLPKAGVEFIVVNNELEAKAIISSHSGNVIEKTKNDTSDLDIFARMQDTTKTISIILKADVYGALEALADKIKNCESDNVKLCIVTQGVGNITENDVILASKTQAYILGFNTSCHIKNLVKQYNVTLVESKVIYNIVDYITDLVDSMKEKEMEEKIQGKMLVTNIFTKPKLGTIAGGVVQSGKITSNSQVKIQRNTKIIGESKVLSLKYQAEEKREVTQNFTCGVIVENFDDFQINDIIISFYLGPKDT